MKATMTFTPNDTTRPERVVAEAEMHFADDPLLDGLKLVGFTIWRVAGTADAAGPGGLYVTLPSRAFGAGVDRRYFDYLRSDAAGPEYAARTKRLKDWIVAQYLAWAGGAA